MSLIPQLTDAGKGLLISALSGNPLTFSRIKIGNGTAPDAPRNGNYWYDTDNLVLKRYSERWETSNRRFTAATYPHADPMADDLWYNTVNETLYIYGDGWNVSEKPFTCATSAPDAPEQGDSWYDTANATLYEYGHKWNAADGITITCEATAPATPTVGDYWYDMGNSILKICTHVWNTKQGVTITCEADAPESPATGDYWYDTVNATLKIAAHGWREKTGGSLSTAEVAPETPAEGDYWYDTANTVLMKYSGTEWAADAQPFAIGDTAPATPAVGDWWYDGASGTLEEYALTWQSDTTHTISYSASEPENAETDDWWYDSANSALMEWGLGWINDTAHTFTYGTAPTSPVAGDWWFDNSLHVYEDGWVVDTDQPFHYGDTAAVSPTFGTWWYDSANSVLYEYGMQWKVDAADVFDYSDASPARPQDGDLWFNTETSLLQEYRTGWITDDTIQFTYSSIEPTEPNTGDWWYDTGTSTSLEYNGAQWNLNSAPIFCGASAPATQDVLTDLVNPMISVAITSMTQGSNYVSITGAFDNSEITTGFRWTETGIFANDSEGNEHLYAYCYAGDDYETIPPNDCGKTIGINLTLLVMVGDAENVTAIAGEGATYASKEELAEHIRNLTNPHKVNKEQIGLGNVENVSPSDAVVHYTIPTQFTEPQEGDTTATVFGKIKLALSTLMAHLKATNPHGLTPAKIKAAEERHEHDAGDINSGVLTVLHGGTGVASIPDLAKLLEAYYKIPVFGVFTGNGTAKRKIELGFTPSAVFLCDGRGRVGGGYGYGYPYEDFGRYGAVCGGLCVGSYGLRIPGCTVEAHETTWSDGHTAMLIADNGFYVSSSENGRVATNASGETYRYIAFR